MFFSAAYTEGLFLLTLIGAVYHFHNNQLLRAACWGFVCGLTRPNGALLSIVLALMAVAPMWDSIRWRPILPPPPGWQAIAQRILAAGSPGYGMLAFSAFIYRLTGNPFQWTMQNAAWGRTYRSLDSIVSDRVGFIANNGFYNYASTQTIDFFYLLAVLLALAAVWPVYRRCGPAVCGLHPDHDPAADGRGRVAIDGTGDVDSVPGVPVDGRGRAGASPHGVDCDFCHASRIRRGDVFYMETVVLSCVTSYTTVYSNEDGWSPHSPGIRGRPDGRAHARRASRPSRRRTSPPRATNADKSLRAGRYDEVETHRAGISQRRIDRGVAARSRSRRVVITRAPNRSCSRLRWRIPAAMPRSSSACCRCMSASAPRGAAACS